MSISNSKDYNPKTFQVGELFRAFSEIEATLGEGVVFKHFILQERHADGALSTDLYTDLLPLEKVCNFSRSTINVYCTDRHGGELKISIAALGEALLVSCQGDHATSLSDAFMLIERRLGLIPYTRPMSSSVDQSPRLSLEDFNNRLQVLEMKLLRRKDLLCFLSYRFTEANELQALRLQRFLDLLDVRLMTGASYEPRRVTDKVLSRLKEPLDFVIVLVTEDGESFWTRDETNAALHRNLPLIPVVQDGVNFTPGLFGDVEYIRFTKDHIGDAFMKLLEAVIFLRNKTHREVGEAQESR